MAVTIDSTRFGAIEILDEAVVEFPTGLIGLGGRRYAFLHREESAPFVWLHSLDDPSLAIPVTKPGLFFADYDVDISDSEAERIGLSDPSQAEVYVTVRAAEAIGDFRANLRAPIVVVNGRGHQVINEAGGMSVQTPLFSEVPAVESVA